MALAQFIRTDSRIPVDVGFYYEGVPQAGIALGVFAYRFDTIIDITQCTLNADTLSMTPKTVYLTVDNAVIAEGHFVGTDDPYYSPASASTIAISSNQTIRLIAPNPADDELSGIRTTLAITRLATDGV